MNPTKIILKWTGGNREPNRRFHASVLSDGTIVRHADPADVGRFGIAYGRDNGLISLASAGMKGATPFDFGHYPLTISQTSSMCKEAARLCLLHGIQAEINYVFTHAEAAFQDGYGVNTQAMIKPFDFLSDSPIDEDQESYTDERLRQKAFLTGTILRNRIRKYMRQLIYDGYPVKLGFTPNLSSLIAQWMESDTVFMRTQTYFKLNNGIPYLMPELGDPCPLGVTDVAILIVNYYRDIEDSTSVSDIESTVGGRVLATETLGLVEAYQNYPQKIQEDEITFSTRTYYKVNDGPTHIRPEDIPISILDLTDEHTAVLVEGGSETYNRTFTELPTDMLDTIEKTVTQYKEESIATSDMDMKHVTKEKSETVATTDTVQVSRQKTFLETCDISDSFTANLVLYVDTATGNNANNGSISTPLKTIGSTGAVAKVKANTVVYIKGGTYTERVQTVTAGTPTGPIVFKPWPETGTVIVDGTGINLAGAANNGLFELRHSYNEVYDLEIINAKTGGITTLGGSGIILSGTLTNDLLNIKISGCNVHDCNFHGIGVHSARQTASGNKSPKYLTIQGNTVTVCGIATNTSGMFVIAEEFLIDNNTVNCTTANGYQIIVDAGSKYGEITRNIVTGVHTTGKRAIRIANSTYVRAHRNNITDSNVGFFIVADNASYTTSNLKIYNNVMVGISGVMMKMFEGWFTQPMSSLLFTNNSGYNLEQFGTLGGGATAITGDIQNNIIHRISGTGQYWFPTGALVFAATNTFTNDATLFYTDAPNGNFNLVGTSAAVNAGTTLQGWTDDLGRPYSITNDYNGNTRFIDQVDQGAFEFQTIIPPLFEWWVDYASGVNDAQHGTEVAPFRTIAYAVAQAQSGSTIHIKGNGNVYNERVQTVRGGGAGAPITLLGEGTPLPKIYPTSTVLGDQNTGIVEIRHSYIALKNLIVQGSTTIRGSNILLTWPVGGGGTSEIDHILIEGCEVYDSCYHGITTNTGMQPAENGRMPKDITIRGCTVHDCTLLNLQGGANGQAVSIIAEGLIVENCTFYDNVDISVDVWLGCKDAYVRNNIFEGYRNSPNRQHGTTFYTDGATNIHCYNNIFKNNHFSDGITVGSEDARYPLTSYIYVYNNIVYGIDGALAAVPRNAISICSMNGTNINECYIYNNTVYNCFRVFYSGGGSSSTVTLRNTLGFYFPGGGSYWVDSGTVVDIDAPCNIYQPNANAVNFLTNPTNYPTIVNGVNDANGYTLKADPNAAVDQGVAVTSFITTDFIGNPRTYPTGVDIGAIERQS